MPCQNTTTTTAFCNFSWLLLSRGTYLVRCALVLFILLLSNLHHQHSALACPAVPSNTNTNTNDSTHHTGMHKHSSSLLPTALRQQTTRRVTLIGDSILDNKAYVRRTLPSVSQLLRKKAADLDLDWSVSLGAIDGDVMAGVPRQLKAVPNDTDVLVLSIGGNDGLRYLGRLQSMGMHNPLNFVTLLSEVRGEFTQAYGDTLDQTIALGKKVIVCTIYYPRFSNWLQQKVSCAGLYIINGIITSEAAKRGLPVIDLAAVFDQDHDYANPIEPGVMGADKLTSNIIRIVREHPWEEGHRVYADRTYTIASPEELRDDKWSHEPRAQRLGRWDWEGNDDSDKAAVADYQAAVGSEPAVSDLPDLKDNDAYREL